jgi:hypothetical protein
VRIKSRIIGRVFKFGRLGIFDSIRVGKNYTFLRMCFGIDLQKSISYNGVSIEISMYDKPFSLVEDTEIDIQTSSDEPNSFIGLAKKESKSRENSEKQKRNALYQTSIDITKIVPNDSSRKLSDKVYDVYEFSDSKVAKSSIETFPANLVNTTERIPTERELRNQVLLGKDLTALEYRHPSAKIEDVVFSPEISLFSNKTSKNIARKFKKPSPYSIRNQESNISYRKGKLSSNYYPFYEDLRVLNTTLQNLSSAYFVLNFVNKNGKLIDRAQFTVNLDTVKDDIKIHKQREKNENSETKYRVYKTGTDVGSWQTLSKDSDEDFRMLLKDSGNPLIVRKKDEARVFLRKTVSTSQKQISSFVVPFYPTRNLNNYIFTVKSIDQGYYSLQKREPLKREQFQDISTDSQFASTGDNIEFEDADLQDGNYYEYRIRFTDRNGNQSYSSNAILKKFVSRAYNQIGNSFIQPITGSSNLEFSFSVNFEQTKSVEQYDKTLLDQGIRADIISGSKSDIENYNGIPVYEVIRYNLDNGDVDYFGNFTDPVFVDDSATKSARKRVKITPLNPENSYAYCVRIGDRPIPSLSRVSRVSSLDTNNKSYEFNGYKFRSRRDYTSLPSNFEMSQKDKDTRFNIDNFDIGLENSIIKRSSRGTASLENLSVRRTLLKSNIIRWNFSFSEVDHFQIWALVDGVKSLIGTVDGSSSNKGEFFYLDEQLFDRVGKVTYSIVPIDFNFRQIIPEVTIQIVTKNNLPLFLR